MQERRRLLLPAHREKGNALRGEFLQGVHHLLLGGKVKELPAPLRQPQQLLQLPGQPVKIGFYIGIVQDKKALFSLQQSLPQGQPDSKVELVVGAPERR